MNKGSQWSKWDLHVHTPFSILNNGFGNDWDNYVKELFTRAIKNNISAIGITDYFNIDGYKKLKLEYLNNTTKLNELFTQEEINKINKILVLPNIEFRLNKLVGGNRINYHILFSNNVSAEDIEENFLHELDFVYESNPQAHDEKRKLKRKNLEQLGNKLKEEHEYFRTKSDLEIGMMNAVVDDEQITQLLQNKSSIFKDNYFILLPCDEDLSKLSWNGQDHHTRKLLIQKTDILIATNPNTIKWGLGQFNASIEDYIKEFKSVKPCIGGSDSHNFDELFTKNDIRSTWIKANVTFEGLKQIIYEPEERLKIQENNPDQKEDKEIIDKVKFISPNNVFSNEEIYLNPNLNVIIGGKSSGKSILLYSIAKTLLPEINDKLLIKNNGSEKYDLNSIDSNFDFEITTKAGISQKMSDRENGDNSVMPNIKYIPQNELVKLAEPELNDRGESLNKLVRNLICEDSDSKAKYTAFLNKVKNYDKSRENLIDSYFNNLEEIQKLEAELKTKSNKEVLETNIRTNSEKVEELNKKAGLSAEEIQQYQNLQTLQEQNQQRRNLFNQDLENTNSFLNELKNEIVALQDKKNDFLQNTNIIAFKEYYQAKLNFIDNSISQLENLIKEIELNEDSEGEGTFANENLFKNELDKISSEKKDIENKIKPYQQNEEIQKQIASLNVSIANDKKLLEEIDTLNKNITAKKETLSKTKDNLFQLYKQSFDEYTNIVNVLKDRTTELEKDGLQIKGVAQFNFPKFRENILSFTDKRSSSDSDYDILKTNKTRTITYDYSNLEAQLKDIFNDIFSGQYVVNTRHSIIEIIKKLLDDYFYDYWEITYRGDKLGEMSTGKASFVILMLIVGLSKSKSPILIDQPEDNLDNRSVSENIIEYLRNKKVERQIILVTHNANIVVNADAENVIVANQKGQNNKDTTSPYKFDYINGAIENTFAKIESQTDLLKSMGIKEHIADIVEGGKEAFKSRERKYGF